MLFNSVSYAIFLPTVFLLYWILPYHFRWILLLAASYFFYMSWNTKYVVLIFGTTLVSYLCALAIEHTSKICYKRIFLCVALFVSFGILYLFKYFSFSMELLNHIAQFHIPDLQLLLPVGISFYTFQTLSYVIDVYREDIQAERHFGLYATYVSFFPQLVAGPIERSSNLLPQFREKRSFDLNNVTYGARLILWGLYKKMVIADNLAVYVDQIYNNVKSYKGGSLILASLFFSLQIYCDFSGYSDIARGSAKLLNINLMENFRSPYFSHSVKEFWSRWHISLSTWFRDYVYIPLGGNRVSKGRTYLNLLITFMISGLWHGANLTYVLWGGVHGLLQICEKVIGKDKKYEISNIAKAVRIVGMFAVVTLAWVFFRASSLQEAVYLIRYMFTGLDKPQMYLMSTVMDLGLTIPNICKIVFLYLSPLFVYDFFSLRTDICEWIGRRTIFIRYFFVVTITILILMFGYTGTSSFVYFQF